MIVSMKVNQHLYKRSLSRTRLRCPRALEYIASVPVFLGSKITDYMTNQTFRVDGGSIKLR